MIDDPLPTMHTAAKMAIHFMTHPGIYQKKNIPWHTHVGGEKLKIHPGPVGRLLRSKYLL